MFLSAETSVNIFITIVFIFSFKTTNSLTNFGTCKMIINDSCDTDYVKFYLYTRNTKESPEFISIHSRNYNLTDSSFQSNSVNKIIIHGYNADSKHEILLSIKDEYLKSGDMNVWMMDWADIANCYLFAIYNARHAGRCLARFIRMISNYTNNEDIHVIGFSLGAHVPASTAAHLQPYRIPRVTGLDPAFPLIMLEEDIYKLNPANARFVDVIHTNGLQQGQLQSSGHADFYLNGGLVQPGCLSLNVAESLHCSHHRAIEYFVESINSEVGFWGRPCRGGLVSYAIGLCPAKGTAYLMGEHVANTTRGLFMVTTGAKSPYALGMWK